MTKKSLVKLSPNMVQKPSTKNTIIGRGLQAIQKSKIAISDQDTRYRKARNTYDQITVFGWERRFDSKLLPRNAQQLDLFEDNPNVNSTQLINKTIQLANVFEQLKKLSEEGYGKAFFLLCTMYWGGQGIAQDLEKFSYYKNLAFEWNFNHRFSDDPEIWHDLAWMYANGLGIDGHINDLEFLVREEEDFMKGIIWNLKAAKKGHVAAQFNLARNCPYHEQPDFWYKKAANQGHAYAQYCLGERYDKGLGDVPRPEKAVYWWQKAAELDFAKAQTRLGFMYREGRGVEESPERALFWWQRAAELGDSEAKTSIYFMNKHRWCLKLGDEQALHLWRMATAHGDANAQKILSTFDFKFND